MKRSFTGRTVSEVLRGNKRLTAALLAVVLAVVGLSLVPPQLLRLMIDRNLTPRRTEGLAALAALYLLAQILSGAFDFLKNAVLTVFGQKLIYRLRLAMFQKLQRIGSAWFSANAPGVITSRLMNDVDNVDSLFEDGVVGMVIDCFKIVGIVASIFLFSVRLGLITLCAAPLIWGVTRAFQKRMLLAQTENLAQLGRVNGHISESLQNFRMIKSFGKEDYMERGYCERLAENFRTIGRVNFYDSCYAPIIQTGKAAFIALVITLSSSQVSALGISIGAVAASIDLISNLFSPIETLGMELQNIQKGLSGIRRINDFDREPEEPPKDERLTAQAVLGAERRAALEFQKVSFAYDPEQPVLRELSFCVEPGSSVTFAGRTGVGKTTLFRLTLGLLPAGEGRVTLNGTDVYAIPNKEKRAIFGYVEQSFSFVRGTVADQITMGDPGVSREQVERAMRFVGLDEQIRAMPEGYDTVLTGEGGFSQGQQQLLAIARAIAADPAVLLLDEITANLDAATEERVVSVLRRAVKGRTVLTISHRLTAMLDCDRIILLENGAIRAEGPPERILREDEWFRTRLRLEQSAWASEPADSVESSNAKKQKV